MWPERSLLCSSQTILTTQTASILQVAIQYPTRKRRGAGHMMTKCLTPPKFTMSFWLCMIKSLSHNLLIKMERNNTGCIACQVGHSSTIQSHSTRYPSTTLLIQSSGVCSGSTEWLSSVALRVVPEKYRARSHNSLIFAIF